MVGEESHQILYMYQTMNLQMKFGITYFLTFKRMLNNFIFLEMDANPKKYAFENPAQFFNEPLTLSRRFSSSF